MSAALVTIGMNEVDAAKVNIKIFLLFYKI